MKDGRNDGERKVEGNSSPSTYNQLMFSMVEGVEGKIEIILFSVGFDQI